MDGTMTEGYGIPIGSSLAHASPKEVSLVSFTLHLRTFTRKQLSRRLQQAYVSGALQLVKRLHALLALAQGQSVSDVAEMLSLGEHTVRDDRNPYLCKGMASLVYKAPPGRPGTRTTTQRQQLAEWIKASPHDAGYTSGCWNTPMIQDLIQRHFGVAYHPHSIATLRKNMGFSSQKARLVSAHLNEAKRLEWRHTRWPKILRQAKQRKALVLLGDEASLAQWGSLSYTWAPKGQQPEVPTSGTRKAYKVFGRMDSFSGPLFYKAHAGRFNAESSTAFLLDVLAQTTQHVVVMQEGARYDTRKAMQVFFERHAERLTIEPLPAYSPDGNPLEHLWKKVKKEATHLKHFPAFTDLQHEVDRALRHFAQTSSEITVLMARYCEKLGQVDKAA
jgi:transposase